MANRQYNEKRCLELLSELAPISDPPSTSEAKRLIWQRDLVFAGKTMGLARTDFETLLEDPDYQKVLFEGCWLRINKCRIPHNLIYLNGSNRLLLY